MKRLKLIVFALMMAGFSAMSYAQTGKKVDEGPKAIVLINPFIVPESKLKETIRMWEQARDFLQKQPGYLSTALHQSLSSEATYRLINVAQWESAEAYEAATRKMRAEANLPQIEGVRPGGQLYTVIRRD